MLSLPKGLTSVVHLVTVITFSRYAPLSFFLSHVHSLRSSGLYCIFFYALLTRINTNQKKSIAPYSCARFRRVRRSGFCHRSNPTAEKPLSHVLLQLLTSLLAPRLPLLLRAGDVALGQRFILHRLC